MSAPYMFSIAGVFVVAQTYIYNVYTYIYDYIYVCIYIYM